MLWTGFDISIVAQELRAIRRCPRRFCVCRHKPRARPRLPTPRRWQTARQPDEVEHETLTGVALMNAFLGLFLSAVQYSLLAGENGCALTGGRASSAELLGGISFVASVYLLLYAVVQFVSGSAETLAKHCVFIVAVLVPPIGVFFIEATLSDLALALADPGSRRPLEPLWSDANDLSVPIALTVLVVCATVWRIGRGTRMAESGFERPGPEVPDVPAVRHRGGGGLRGRAGLDGTTRTRPHRTFGSRRSVAVGRGFRGSAGGPERGVVIADRRRGRLRRARSAFGAAERVGDHRCVETLELQRLLSDGGPVAAAARTVRRMARIWPGAAAATSRAARLTALPK